MFIELVDALRCPVAHEESWLVAAAMRMEARHIVEGTLGCPVCRVEYPIREGVVDFRSIVAPAARASSRGDADQAMRLAALLDLSDAQGFAVLLGEWGTHGAELSAIVALPLILVDPPANVRGAPGLSVIRCDGDLPLASGAARAMAIDAASTSRIGSAVRSTRTNGRVLAPIATPVPADVNELARDETLWVGETMASASPIVTLHVRRA